MPSLLQGKESAKLNHPMGKAEHVISIWLGGGMGQIDTFDPKRKGDPKEKIPGSYYDSINTAVPGVQLCEHLPRVAPLMDRVTAVRTVNHKVIDEHAAATNFMHTGRPISGTVTYPSIGSLIAHERGPADESALRAQRVYPAPKILPVLDRIAETNSSLILETQRISQKMNGLPATMTSLVKAFA